MTTRKRLPWYVSIQPSVLVARGKYGDLIWAYTTEDERRGAMLALFRRLDSMEFYSDFDDHEDDPQAVLPGFEPPSEQREQRTLLTAARRGDADAAYKLLSLRRDYEYEGWAVKHLEEL
jgi:hypothetical protein